MPVYYVAGPLVALIGIVAVFFVMRHKSVQTRSMYSSRRSQIERKVKAARSRTLAPRGRGDKPPTEQEIAAAATGFNAAPVYEPPPPAAPSQQGWDVGPAPPPVAYPPSPAPAFDAAVQTPPSAPAEPSTPTPQEPIWTPAPSESSWTPGAAAEAPAPPAVEPIAAEPAAAASGGAAWSVVGDARPTTAEPPAKDKDKDKGRKKDKAAATGGGWELSSGEAPGEDEDEVKKPSAAMAIAQYAVMVGGLLMILIGVLIMVANGKFT